MRIQTYPRDLLHPLIQECFALPQNYPFLQKLSALWKLTTYWKYEPKSIEVFSPGFLTAILKFTFSADQQPFLHISQGQKSGIILSSSPNQFLSLGIGTHGFVITSWLHCTHSSDLALTPPPLSGWDASLIYSPSTLHFSAYHNLILFGFFCIHSLDSKVLKSDLVTPQDFEKCMALISD